MLARSSKLIHKASGVTVETPLLIPSFSSKGIAKDKKGKSNVGSLIKFASEFLTKTCLISAYDMFYKHMDPIEELPLLPELVFIDSGGYEVSWDNDYSSYIQAPPNEEKWEPELHQSVLDSWPDEIPAVIVNYDHPKLRIPLTEQIKNARELFSKFNTQIHLFLLKPETDTQTTLKESLKSALSDIEELSYFDIIGVTEKELGSSILERMTNIAKLRRAMDEAGLNSKIHIFGALDPLSVCYYFLSGAEIFDGLTWIRYAYEEGRCVYFHNHGALNYGLHMRDQSIKLRAMTENIYSLETMEHRMREFLATNDFSKFAPHEINIKEANDSLITKLKGA